MTSMLTRRTVLKTAALASTAVAAPFVRGAFAAGKLSCGFWDHWVPTATDPLEKLCREWAEKEKVDIKVDFITSNGDKDLLTAGRRGAGADPDTTFCSSSPGTRRARPRTSNRSTTSMAALIEQHGTGQRRRRISRQAERPLGRGADRGRQHAVAALRPHRPDEAVRRARRDQDVPGRRAARQELDDSWTWDFFSQAAEKCHKAGYPFGMPMSTTQRRGAIGSARCSTPTASSWSTQRATSPSTSDAHRAGARMVQEDRAVLPAERLCLGRRLEQQGADLRPERADLQRADRPGRWPSATRRRSPSSCGPSRRRKARRAGMSPAATAIGGSGISRPTNRRRRACLLYLSTRDCDRASWSMRAKASTCRPLKSSTISAIWAEAEPPKGTLYNFPPRGEVIVSVAGYPAPAKIGVQMYSQGTMCKMIAQCTQQGRSIDEAIDFGERELEGFSRT